MKILKISFSKIFYGMFIQYLKNYFNLVSELK